MTTHFYKQQWHDGQQAAFTSQNPATGEVIWSGNNASEQQVNEAIKSARTALSTWAFTTIEQRLEYLRRYQEILRNNVQKFTEAISLETGKPLWEAATEAGAMVGKIDLSITAYNERTGETVKDLNGVTSRVRHKPHGVLAVFGPYNFPGHLPNGHIVPALLAGNSIVYKPSELTPMVAQIMVELLVEAGFPDGVVNLVQGTKDTGIALANHSGIDGLLFTGSTQTGSLLHKQFAGNTGVVLALEMGGNNPLIVHEVNDLKAAIYNTIQSAYITAGQRCTCARRLIVVDDQQGQEFVRQLISATSAIKVGSAGAEPEPFMGPVISNAASEQLIAAQQKLIELGAKPLLPMQRVVADKPFVSPGILDVTSIENLPDEEYFGPLLQLVFVKNVDDAIAEANNTRFGLAAGILTDNDQIWEQFYRLSRAGIVNRNRPLTGASGSAPFGGIGASGNHNASAYYAADYSAYPVASLEDDQLALPEKLTIGIVL